MDWIHRMRCHGTEWWMLSNSLIFLYENWVRILKNRLVPITFVGQRKRTREKKVRKKLRIVNRSRSWVWNWHVLGKVSRIWFVWLLQKNATHTRLVWLKYLNVGTLDASECVTSMVVQRKFCVREWMSVKKWEKERGTARRMPWTASVFGRTISCCAQIAAENSAELNRECSEMHSLYVRTYVWNDGTCHYCAE